MAVRILTLVTNGRGGTGPGHSAVAVNDKVYSFEEFLGANTSTKTSGWKIFGFAPYLKKNGHRPALVQWLTQVQEKRVLAYINESIRDDDDYGTSGVCSQQVSMAIDYGLPKRNFNPRGFDTPYGVYHHARNKGLVQREEYFWTNRAELNALAWARIANKLKREYPLAYKHSKNGWTP